MNKEETKVEVPVAPPGDAVPHLSEAEIATIREMERQKKAESLHIEHCYFRKMLQKPQKINRPKMFNEEGKVVCFEGTPAPVSKGNLGKGTLRNKKCSCGSGRKFKKCCLNSKTN